VGVSNNRFRAIGPPSWQDAKLALSGDVTIEIRIRY